jgi:hypothetical protein
MVNGGNGSTESEGRKEFEVVSSEEDGFVSTISATGTQPNLKDQGPN